MSSMLGPSIANAQPADPLAAPPPGATAPPQPTPPSPLAFVVPDYVVPGARFVHSTSIGQMIRQQPQGPATSTSAGLLRTDVIAVTDSMVLLAQATYVSYTAGGRGVVGSGLAAVRASDPASGTLGALWVSKEALTAMQEARTMQVAQEQWPINGRTYDAVVFTREAQDSAHRYAYDRARGLLLASQIATGQGQAFNRETSSVSVFQTYRAVTLPWFSAAAPAWTQTFKQLSYEGRSTLDGRGIAPSIVTPGRVVVAVSERGPGWAILRSTVQIQGQAPVTSTTATGPASIGGYWISPAALRQMAPGVVDRDPTLGTTLAYRIEDTPGGRLGMLIESDNAGSFQRAFGYSLDDGVLVYSRAYDAAMGTTTEYLLSARE
jgi:hypothetical protein